MGKGQKEEPELQLKQLMHPSPSLQIRELVPESQAYMDLLAFERKLDQTIARKRMEIQEAIKKPLTVCAALANPRPLLGLVFWGSNEGLQWVEQDFLGPACFL